MRDFSSRIGSWPIATVIGLALVLSAPMSAVHGQVGDARLEIGAARAFAPTGSDVLASTYLTIGLRVDRWTRRGGVFAGVLGGISSDSVGGDWGSLAVGGEVILGASAPVELALMVTGYGFRVGEPFTYTAATGQARPELRFKVSPDVTLVLQGEGGVGKTTVELRRGDLSRTFESDLWHYGGGPELRIRLGRALASLGGSVLRSDAGIYRRGVLRLGSNGSGPVWDASINVWDTPLGMETTGGLSITIPLGGGWMAQAIGGRSDPDPLIDTQPGAQGGVVVARSLVTFGPGPSSELVTLQEDPAGTIARFMLVRSGVSQVQVLGDFSAWEPVEMRNEGRHWVVEIPVESGAHHFGFLVDGEWFVPETATGRVSDEWGRINATLLVP
ncbi:MAG: glycogen-binding domain-containing protein [Longimicrobiales bacterium]